MVATSAAYNFWLYELCDVYIVGFIFDLTRMSFHSVSVFSGSDETNDGRVGT